MALCLSEEQLVMVINHETRKLYIHVKEIIRHYVDLYKRIKLHNGTGMGCMTIKGWYGNRMIHGHITLCLSKSKQQDTLEVGGHIVWDNVIECRDCWLSWTLMRDNTMPKYGHGVVSVFPESERRFLWRQDGIGCDGHMELLIHSEFEFWDKKQTYYKGWIKVGLFDV